MKVIYAILATSIVLLGCNNNKVNLDFPMKGKYYSTHTDGLKKVFDEEYISIINDSTYTHYYKVGKYEYLDTSKFIWEMRKERNEFVMTFQNFKSFYNGPTNDQIKGNYSSLFCNYIVEENSFIIRGDMESTIWDFVMKNN